MFLKVVLTLYKRQSQKMDKHNQTIRRQQSTNCLSVFVHFVRLALKYKSSYHQNLKGSVPSSYASKIKQIKKKTKQKNERKKIAIPVNARSF